MANRIRGSRLQEVFGRMAHGEGRGKASCVFVIKVLRSKCVMVRKETSTEECAMEFGMEYVQWNLEWNMSNGMERAMEMEWRESTENGIVEVGTFFEL